MNHILSKGLIFGLMFTLFGCQDFLEKEVLGNSTDETFYETRYQLEASLNATYDVLQMDLFNECEWRFGEATADNVWGNDEGLASQMGQLVQFRFNTSNQWIRDRYTVNYKGIHRANQVIANARKVKMSVEDYASYTSIRQIVGQAKFLRAFFYFNLVKTYGGVPIRPEVETDDNLVIPRSTKEEVYAYIEKDLREAAVMLPAGFTGANAGRAGEGAAVALLMKALMYQAVPGIPSEKWQEMVRLGEFFIDGKTMTYADILKYDGDEEDWESVRKRLWFKSEELNLEKDPYETPETTLDPLHTTYSLEYRDYYGEEISYDEQFYQVGEFCKGSIFEVVFKESGDGTGGDTNDGTPIFSNLFTRDHNPPMFANETILEEIYGADPRRRFNLTHQTLAPGGEITETGVGKYLSLKWYTLPKERPQFGGDDAKNRRVIRFVEVVLMYAEALNECGERGRALEQLNKSKAQANTINQGTALYVASGYGEMRDQIWEERRIELAFEWDRFFDLVRQGRAAEVIKNYGLKRANRRGFYFRKGVNELFPIPQNEIDISNGVVEQNPGY